MTVGFPASLSTLTHGCFFLVVEFFMDIPELAVGHMSVDLRGGNVGVTEHYLYRADVGAVVEEVGGEAVAEDVGSDFVHNARFGGIVLHHSFDGAWSEADGSVFACVPALLHEKRIVHIRSLF